MDIAEVIGRLELNEKVSLLTGSGLWHSTAVERLGIPSFKVTDGPNGARGDAVSGKTAASFPVGSAMGATWNVDLIRRVGVALGQETKTKGAQVLLGPTVNIHRTPLGGRNFECYSEDPLLTGELASAFIAGVQSERVAACIKHFVCNDSEFERHSISSEVDERTLREIYLRPFEMAVQRSCPWSIMSSYNRINGTFASSNSRLLQDILRGEWGFDGVVISDWFAAIETVENALGGLDLEMPGPTISRGAKLLAAVQSGQVPEAILDESIRRLLLLMERTGKLDAPDELPEESVDRPEHRELALKVAEESMVLITNNLTLPLEPALVKRILVVGPNAEEGQIQGGGSSVVRPHYQVSPLDGIRARFGDDRVEFLQGCFNHKYMPLPVNDLYADEALKTSGFRVRLFQGSEFKGDAVLDRRLSLGGGNRSVLPLNMLLGDALKRGFSARLTGVYQAPGDGEYTFGLLSAGLARLAVDGEPLIDNWSSQDRGDAFFGSGSTEKRAVLSLSAGQRVDIAIEFLDTVGGMAGVRFGVLPPVDEDMMQQAIDAARAADVVIIVAGSNADWETEGNDRLDLLLPGAQNELIDQLLQANSKSIVVLNTGSATAMPWIGKAGAVIQAWLPGQEFGHALARILSGDVSPSGRMPTTLPFRLEDTPAYTSYPGEAGKVYYGERGFVGYRWYDTRGIRPMVCFGHGLSYTRFGYSDLRVPASIGSTEPLRLFVTVTNEGRRGAAEVVQCYLHESNPVVQRPLQELKCFKKVYLQAGESKVVTMEISHQGFAFWDVTTSNWNTQPGSFEVRIGASSRDIRCTAVVELTALSQSLKNQ